MADLGLTKVIDGNLVKVCAWYDNEMGYTATLIKHVLKIGEDICNIENLMKTENSKLKILLRI